MEPPLPGYYQYFGGVKCLAQGHDMAEVGLEPPTSCSGVRCSTTEPPRSPLNDSDLNTSTMIFLSFWTYLANSADPDQTAFIRVFTYCISVIIFWSQFSEVKPHCQGLRVRMAINTKVRVQIFVYVI